MEACKLEYAGEVILLWHNENLVGVFDSDVSATKYVDDQWKKGWITTDEKLTFYTGAQTIFKFSDGSSVEQDFELPTVEELEALCMR